MTKKGRGKQSRFREARLPIEMPFLSAFAVSATSRAQRLPVFPTQIVGCRGARAGAGMAVRAALLLAVLLLSHRPGDTAILEANGNRSCRCLKSTRAFIPPKRYSSVEMWPVGSSCRRPEVVITLKSLKRVCVDPDTPWMRKLLQDLPHL
uniref:Chemokine interleukin-8-like domain-containing protein n=1 Tax=Zonotrichia albicollis TaxID=44394 RepID=A0A8D2MWE5_ZONAL